MKSLFALAFAGAFLLGCADAQPTRPVSQGTYLAGDSHCVGLAQATGLKSFARVGAPTREVVSQLKGIPENTVVIVCAGTNDAPNRLAGFSSGVDAALAEAKARNQRLIWVGPINTRLWWDVYSAQAEAILKSKTDFVSMRRQWGAGEHDGQFHLTPKGRAVLWNLIKEKL